MYIAALSLALVITQIEYKVVKRTFRKVIIDGKMSFLDFISFFALNMRTFSTICQIIFLFSGMMLVLSKIFFYFCTR